MNHKWIILNRSLFLQEKRQVQSSKYILSCFIISFNVYIYLSASCILWICYSYYLCVWIMLIDKRCSFSFDRLLKPLSVQSIITAPCEHTLYEFRAFSQNQRKQRSLVVKWLWYGCLTNQNEFDPRQKPKSRSSPPFPDRHWGPTSPLFNRYQRAFSHLYLRNCGRKECVELNLHSP